MKTTYTTMSFRIIKGDVADAVYNGLGNPSNFKNFVHAALDRRGSTLP